MTKRKQHKIWPYLLRGRTITGSNEAWCADITYVPMAKGFLYLVAIMDWASRKVLASRLSNGGRRLRGGPGRGALPVRTARHHEH